MFLEQAYDNGNMFKEQAKDFCFHADPFLD